MTEIGIILAAGRGQRLDPGGQAESYSKPLIEVGGKTLLERTIGNCRQAGLKKIYVVTGYKPDLVEAEVLRLDQGDLRAVFNSKWTLSNGVSAFICNEYVRQNFLLMMSDHIIDPNLTKKLAQAVPEPGTALLAVDYKIDQVFDLDDATKLQVDDQGRIVAIDKKLKSYNAIDCGLFHCTPAAFTALGSVYEAKGDTSLSDGMRVLAEAGKFKAFDIGDSWWQDVDTPDMLGEALKLLGE